MDDFGLGAAWRRQRYNMAAFAAVIGSSGVAMSSLLKCPGFMYFMVMVDVLHTLDLGVTQEVLGNVFFEC